MASEIIEDVYTNNRGKKYREYLLTQNGFTLYMFNIQGYNDFKVAYINKFNEMKQQLENMDYLRVSQKCPTLGGSQNKVDYALSLDMAKEISMIQRSELGKKFRQYFIDCEKQLMNGGFRLPGTYKEALLQLVEQVEKKNGMRSYFKIIYSNYIN